MDQKPALKPFTSYEKFIIAVITLIQFTIVLDFMVISPLGPFLMKSLQLTPDKFGHVVAAYAFSAFLSGLLAAGVADRFDRKKFLLFFYTGFVIGTLFCALAPSYETLLLARVVTGIFGGVIGAVSMAIITDLFEINQRGRVMGFTQMGFAVAQVLGIPISLLMAPYWGWNSPFYLIVGVAAIGGIVMVMKMKPITAHLSLQNGKSGNALPHLINTLKKKRYQTAFITSALLPLGGYMLMPFGSAFAEHNLGVDPKILWFIFIPTGIASMIAFPVLGKLSDKFNKLAIFAIASLWAMIMVVIHTHWGLIPLWLVITSNILMFIGIMGRIVPATILISAIPEMKDRGAFMSINSSLQQLAGGIGAVAAGLIITQPNETGPLLHMDTVGFVIVGLTIIQIYMMYRVYNLVKDQLPAPGKKGPSGSPAPKNEEPVLAAE